MKKILLKAFFINILLIIIAISAHAQTTYVWTGAAGSAGVGDWATPGNWTVGGVVAADYPGHVGTTDIVDIGVPGVAGPSDTTFVFTNQPVLSSGTVNIASLTFGNNNAHTGTITLNGDGTTTTNTTPGFITLTVNGIINVSGTVLQMHSATGGGANSATTTPPTHSAGTVTPAIYTSILGTGTINCGYLTIGDQTVPGHEYVSNVTVFLIGGSYLTATATLPATTTGPTSSNVTINVTNDFTMNSVSSSQDDAPVGLPTGSPPVNVVVVSRNNDARVIFYQGNLTVGGNFNMVNNNATPAYPFKLFQSAYKPSNKFAIRPQSGVSGVTIHDANFTYKGAAIGFGNPLSSDYANTVDKVDFFDNTGGTGAFTSNVTYGGGNQTVYTDNDSSHVDIGSFVYSKLVLSGNGIKTTNANGAYASDPNPGLTVASTLTVNTGSTFNLVTNNTNLWLFGAYSTAAGSFVNTGTGYVNFASQGYTNNGTSTFGSGLVTYNAASAAPTFSGNGTTNYTNVKFIMGPTTANATLNLGNNAVSGLGTYNILSTGVMQIAQHGTGSAFNTTVNTGTAKLVFLSDASGSATLASLPGTCAVIGSNVTVQRYIAGGSGARGYRLISSAVNNATDGSSNKIYSINHLLNTTYISGTNFTLTSTSKPGNPSLYLYRENLVPTYNSFLTSNFRGINTISASPNYTMDLDGGPFNIPIGNGYLFYFRGGAPATGFTTAFTAGSTPQPGTLAPSGTLNQGNITVADWYTPGTTSLGYSTVSGNAGIEGMNLVGNPYPAAIDWSKFSSTSSGAAIYGPGLSGFIYELEPGNQAGAGNYSVYGATTGSTDPLNTGIIASGQGFFVQAIGTGATLTFTENAKVNTSPGPAVFLAKLPTSAKVTRQHIRLKLAQDTINTDATLIVFNANANAAFNPYEDALYRVGTGKVNLASFTSNNLLAAINSMPLIGKGQAIQLKINASTSGTYTLNAQEILGIPAQYDIWLKDNFTKDSVDLRKNPSYSFTITLADTNTYLSKRFAVVINQNPALAYKLISFDANKVSNKPQAELKWTTANELNSTKFTVERSTDNGKTFDDLDSLVSNGSGSYSYLDKGLHKGDNLYRLKQQDFTNTITFSSTADVKISDKGDNNVRVCVYPNPAVNHIVLTIDPKSQDLASYKIQITNSTGTIVAQAITKDTNWEDNVSQLMTGTYLIQVVNEKDNSLVGQTKFVKL